MTGDKGRMTDDERRQVTPDQVQAAAVDVKLRLETIIRQKSLQIEVDVRSRRTSSPGK